MSHACSVHTASTGFHEYLTSDHVADNVRNVGADVGESDSVQLTADVAYDLPEPGSHRTRALSYFRATDRDNQPLILALNADFALELTDGDGALDVLVVYLRLPLP